MEENSKKPDPKRVFVGTEDAPTFYANNVNVAVSQFDMRLRFALIEDSNREQITFRNLVTVFLSPGQARSLRDLLNKKAGDHERIWSQAVALIEDDQAGG